MNTWTTELLGRGTRVEGPRDLVAIVYGANDAAANANAKLIAAAPELLKELRHLVNLLSPYIDQMSVPGLATLNGAKAAITKATT